MTLILAEPPDLLRAASRMRRSLADAESNVAIDLSRLGCTARWIGVLGQDPIGDAAVTTLRGGGRGRVPRPSRPGCPPVCSSATPRSVGRCRSCTTAAQVPAPSSPPPMSRRRRSPGPGWCTSPGSLWPCPRAALRPPRRWPATARRPGQRSCSTRTTARACGRPPTPVRAWPGWRSWPTWCSSATTRGPC